MTTETQSPPKPQETEQDSLFGISVASAIVGVLLLLGAGMMYFVVSQVDAASGIPGFFDKRQYVLAVGTGLFVLGVGLQASRIWEIVYRRRSLYAVNVILMSVLALFLVGLVDYVTSRHFRKFDWTRDAVYSISDESIQVAQNIDKSIRIWIIFPESPDAELVNQLVDHYKARNPKIEVLKLDPMLDREKLMNAIRELGIDARSLDDVEGAIVQAGYWETKSDGARAWHTDKSKRLAVTDIFESGFDPMSGGRGQKKFRGEQALTNALIEVTEEKKTKIYFLQGHGELDMEGRSSQEYTQMGFLTKELRGKNYDVAALNIIDRPQKDIPPDASIIAIAGAQKTFDQQEITALEKFLHEGGKLMVFASPTFKQVGEALEWTKTGIEPLLRRYNVELEEKVVVGLQKRGVFDPNTGKITEEIAATTECLADQFDATSKITKPLAGLRAAFKEARVLKAVTDSSSNPHAKATEIVKTSPRYFAVSDPTNIEPPKGEHVSLPVIVAVEQKIEAKPGEKEKITRLVVTGDAVFASNLFIGANVNEPLVLNSLAWLVGQERFTKEAVREGDYHLDMSPVLAILYGVFACVGVPILTILVAITVLVVRRR